MNRDELAEKTKQELMAIGTEQGLSFTPANSKGDMIDAILGAPVKIAEKAADMPPEGRLYSLDGKPASGRKFKVTIHATEQDRGDVFLSVNGHGMYVKRNHEVTLDEAYVDVLKNAVIDTFTKDPDTGKVQKITMMHYPFSAIAA